MDKSIALIGMAFALSGCINEDRRQHADADYCPREVVKSDHVSPSLPSEFKAVRYLVKVTSIGEKGACERNVMVAPEHAARFMGGMLLGGDRGEWGGELVFRNSRGKDNTLLKENVVSIEVVEQNAYVFTGLSHLGTSFGSLYVVTNGLPPRLLLKFDAPPSNVSFDEKSELRLRFDTPSAETSDLENAKDSKYLCFSLRGGGEPVEFSCDGRSMP